MPVDFSDPQQVQDFVLRTKARGVPTSEINSFVSQKQSQAAGISALERGVKTSEIQKAQETFGARGVSAIPGPVDQVTDSEKALGSLGDDLDLFEQRRKELKLTGPAFGRIPTGLPIIASLDPSAKAFNSFKDRLSFTLAGALAGQTGRALSDRDVLQFKESLPGREDTSREAQLKLNDVLEQFRSRLVQEGASGSEADKAIARIKGGSVEEGKEALKTSLPGLPGDITIDSLGEKARKKPKDFDAFIKNFQKDLKDNIAGIKHLPKALLDISPIGMFLNPQQSVDTLEAIVVGTVKEYVNLAKDPLGVGFERPVSTLLNILPFLSFGKRASLAGKAGKAQIAAGGLDDAARVAKSTSIANRIYANMFEVSKRRGLRSLSPVKSSSKLVEWGIKGNSLDDLNRIAQTVTGPEGLINKAKIAAVSKLDDIEVVSSIKSLRAGLEKVEDITDANIRQRMTQVHKALNQQTAINKLSPLDAFDVQTSLEALGAQHWDEFVGTKNVRSRQLAQAYFGAAEDLSLEIDNAVRKISIDEVKLPGAVRQLEAISPQLAEDFIAAKNVAELRALEKPFVDLSRMVQETQNNIGRAQSINKGTTRLLGGVAGSSAGPLGAVAGFAIAPILEPIIAAALENLRIRTLTRFASTLPKLRGINLPRLPRTPAGTRGLPFLREAGEGDGAGGGEAVVELAMPVIPGGAGTPTNESSLPLNLAARPFLRK